MQNYSPQGFSALPLVIKNLIIINVLFFLGDMAYSHVSGHDLSQILGLHYPDSDYFKPIQYISYMFMHGGFEHIFFNMFSLWMFGYMLENIWGPKRFFIYYMVTGIGAAIIQTLVTYLRIEYVCSDLDPRLIAEVMQNGAEVIGKGMNYSDPTLGTLNMLINSTTVGASGAVFGILLAYGMMFPNQMIYLYFLFPIKAKWFVIGYGVLELFTGVMNNAGDNVAHFAHLGGMIFGYILIKHWQKNINNYYE